MLLLLKLWVFSTSVFCSISISISHCLQSQQVEIPLSAHHQCINDIFIFWFPKTWIHYSEDITDRWGYKDITMSSFSLYYTWRNDLMMMMMMMNCFCRMVDHWLKGIYTSFPAGTTVRDSHHNKSPTIL